MFSLQPDCSGRMENRVREINTPKALFFTKLVDPSEANWFLAQPEIYESFLRILTEYTYGRIDHVDMYHQVSRLFSAHPEVIEFFGKCFPQANCNKRVNEHDYAKAIRSAKKTKTEDDNSKRKTEFDPASNASISYASDFSRSSGSSDCFPFEYKAVASCSRSVPYRPRMANKGYEAQNKKTARFRDTTHYVTEMKTKNLNEPQAYQHFIKLANKIGESSTDTYATMELVTILLEGYTELIESFNIFLPDEYRIVILSDDREMSID